MKVTGNILMTLGSLAAAVPAFAHQHANCRSLNANSCWHALNEADEAVTIQCDNLGTGQLERDQVYSYQFCSGLDDGLGYAVAEVNCQAHFASGDTVPFTVTGINSGDRVQITSTADKIIVTSRAMWSSKTAVREFRR